MEQIVLGARTGACSGVATDRPVGLGLVYGVTLQSLKQCHYKVKAKKRRIGSHTSKMG